MNISAQYKQKCVSPFEAAAQLMPVRNLILGMNVAMPPLLMEAVATALRNDNLNALDVYYMHGTRALQDTLFSADLRDKVHPHPLFMSAHDRRTYQSLEDPSWMQFVPVTFHQAGRLLTEHIEPDCFMVTVSSMDRHGYFSLGTNADYGASVIRKAKKVIVEVNSHMPRTFGECTVHLCEIDSIVENDIPLPELSPQVSSEVDLMIASQIAERIGDGDTLQMGIGGAPNSVLGLLNDHKNLGLHTELFSTAMVRLIERGVINGREKTWMQHKHVFTLAIGDKVMYDFMDDNPSMIGYPASWVNNPSIIRKNDNMVSVNAAIEVDLSGQINSEQIDGMQFSGTGGQLDFVRGAYASKNGRSFIALHSTARNGTVSRIVPRLKGSVVTDTRMDTHFVVTEYGCVDLKGLSLPQRARALIQLAHPQYREQLEQQASSLRLI
ncbi:MAG TPA: acetyl-CoA hydrolase/transferase family protein [Halieaceae bacterium]|nr:acetyl-CoA hydrolase/transferase family protein [Halieaceae bacterium]